MPPQAEAKPVSARLVTAPTGASTNSEWPNLAGQKYAYLVEQLQAFQDGTRKNPVMTPIARQLSAKDVSDLAAYFSALQGAPPVHSTQIAKAQRRPEASA